MIGARWSFESHALVAMLLLGAWSYTRLVHVLAAPGGYAYRPYMVYRRREVHGAARLPRRSWERTDQPEEVKRGHR